MSSAFLTREPAGRQRESVGCPACGRTIGPAAQVCRYCGVNVEELLALLRIQALDNLARAERLEEQRWQRYARRSGSITSKGFKRLFFLFLHPTMALAVLAVILLGSPMRALIGLEKWGSVQMPLLFLCLFVQMGLFALLAVCWQTRRT